MKTSEIAKMLGGILAGDATLEITSVASLEAAGAGQAAFSAKPLTGSSTNAACLIIAPGHSPEPADRCAYITVTDPKLAFARLAAALHPRVPLSGHSMDARISATAEVDAAYIGAFVSIGDRCLIAAGVEIHDGSRVGADTRIGAGTVIYQNVTIYSGVTIGRNCAIHAGAVIGADGFGFVRDDGGEYVAFPQLGGVVIDDEVVIGANTCVDRGALGDTRIGAGAKIDNLVQIAHNVEIGKRVVIAAQTGISGSTVIEDDCVIGGQVGFGDHARVLSGAVIGSQAGVLPGKIVRPGVWWGTPVQKLDEFKKQNANVKRVGDLRESLSSIEKRVETLEQDRDGDRPS